MLVDGISRKALQQLAVETLKAANTLALDRVYEPLDWPTSPEEFPILLVQIPQERKVSVARGLTQFDTTMTLVVVGRLVGTMPGPIEAALDLLSGQIEEALICTLSFLSNVQQFTTIETQMVVTSEAKRHIGEIGVKFEVEVPQVFGPGAGVPLVDVRGTITEQIGGETLAIADVPLS